MAHRKPGCADLTTRECRWQTVHTAKPTPMTTHAAVMATAGQVKPCGRKVATSSSNLSLGCGPPPGHWIAVCVLLKSPPLSVATTCARSPAPSKCTSPLAPSNATPSSSSYSALELLGPPGARAAAAARATTQSYAYAATGNGEEKSPSTEDAAKTSFAQSEGSAERQALEKRS
eukprot:7254537-Prymnesium_polylepis.2